MYLVYQLKLRIYCFMWQIPIAETRSCKKKGTCYVLEWKHLKQPYSSVCAQTISHLSDFIALDWVKTGEFICLNHDSLCDLIKWCRYVILTALTAFCIWQLTRYNELCIKWWTIPVAYSLIYGLDGKERANLVQLCFEKLHTVGILVVSVIFDGCSAMNFSYGSQVGCFFLSHWYESINPIYCILLTHLSRFA